jgi:geranylgeranyl reductase family protein
MKTDVLIVGAGPGGSSTAYFLAKKGVNVLLSDRETFPREKVCGDGITLSGVQILCKMNILQTLEKSESFQIYKGIRIFAPDGNCVQIEHSDKQDHSISGHGFVIRRNEFDELLKENAVAAGAQFVPGFRAIEPFYTNRGLGGIRGQLSNNVSLNIEARLAVISTGANSKIVRTLNLYPAMNVSGVAMRGYFQTAKPLEPFIELHLNENLLPGYGWIFPLSKRIANIGVGLYKDKRALRPAFKNFIETIQGFREDLREVEPIGQPRGFPLFNDFLNCKTYADGILAVGEAAGLVDPLTGEGISLALQSGELAAKIVYESLLENEFSASMLSKYETILRARYASYFGRASRIRSRLENPKTCDSLIPLLAKVLDCTTRGKSSRYKSKQIIQLLWFVVNSLHILKLTPYFLFLALKSRPQYFES